MEGGVDESADMGAGDDFEGLPAESHFQHHVFCKITRWHQGGSIYGVVDEACDDIGGFEYSETPYLSTSERFGDRYAQSLQSSVVEGFIDGDRAFSDGEQ